MIYYSIPYSTEMNIGACYNSVMNNLPNDTDFACFVDGDTIFTTSDFGNQINDVIKRYPECRFFTCYTNRVGCKIQVCPIIDRDNNDIDYHRKMGKMLQYNYWDVCDDISELEPGTLISGMLLLIRKDLWKEVGGFKNGMLSVDNDFHLKCIEKKEPLYLMKGVYIYHWYRWPNSGNTSHLKTEKKMDEPTEMISLGNKKVVYTCIHGKYDVLRDPLVVNPDWDYVCFTDQNFTSKIWDIRRIPNDCLSEDSKKIQRKMKILPHKYLKNYDWSIWIDGNLQMKIDAQDLLNTHGHNIFNTLAHPERTCLYAELDACERLGKDNPSSLNVIRNKLTEEKYPVNNGLVQSNVIIRKHNDDTIIGLAEAWWSMVKQYSHRDQTMFNYVIWKYPNTVKKMNLFSANVLYNNFNFYTHIKNGNCEIKKHPGPLYGTLDNHINGKLFFKGSDLIPKRIKR
jgi:hypothetical protein